MSCMNLFWSRHLVTVACVRAQQLASGSWVHESLRKIQTQRQIFQLLGRFRRSARSSIPNAGSTYSLNRSLIWGHRACGPLRAKEIKKFDLQFAGRRLHYKQNQIRRCTHSFTVTSTSKGQARWWRVCLRSHGLSLPCQYTFIVSVVRRTRLASLSVNPPTPSQLTIRIDECLVQRDLEFIHLLSEHSTFYHFQIQTHVYVTRL